MKKTYNYLMMLMMLAVAAMSLTGCEDNDDVNQAYDMNGIWQGTIEGEYYTNRYGRNDYDTEIRFVQDGDFSRGGYGEERDYPRWGGRPVYSEFDWEVRNGQILIEYDDGYRVIIRDYELYSVGSGMRFRGYIDNYHTGRPMASFNLVKVSEWADYY